MQDFTNNNQPQLDSANNYYQDPLMANNPVEPGPAEGQNEESPAPEPEKKEPPMLNQDPDAEDEPIRRDQAPLKPTIHESPSGERELSPELRDYLSSTKKLLEKTRKERNNLIVRIDEEEDAITEHLRSGDDGLSWHGEDVFGRLGELKEELRHKKDLIYALIKMVRSLE